MVSGIVYVSLITALASARIAVLLAHDMILDKPRDWFFRHWPPFDNPALGYSYQTMDTDGTPLPMGAKREAYMFSELFTCTRCLTVWTSIPVYIAATQTNIGLLITEVIAVMFVAAWAAAKI